MSDTVKQYVNSMASDFAVDANIVCVARFTDPVMTFAKRKKANEL